MLLKNQSRWNAVILDLDGTLAFGDDVTLSNDEDGVAKYIEKEIL